MKTAGGEHSRVIANLSAAVAALEGISDQGGGMPTHDKIGFNISAGPLGGTIAHFARFKEILVGRRFRPDDTVAGGPTGDPVEIDWQGVKPFVHNPKIADFPIGSTAHRFSLEFAGNYTALLQRLHRVFNGSPGAFHATLGQMYKLRDLADRLASTHDPRFPANVTMGIGPSWEYVVRDSSD